MYFFPNSEVGREKQGQGKIMYFHVNVSPPKPLDVAISNFAAA